MPRKRLSIESLEGRLLLAADYGDAPDTYGTLATSAGPYHSSAFFMLGTARDVENNATPSALADGDGADDDGVTFSPLRAGSALRIRAFVTTQPSSPARLDAWIDFDGDGTFSGAGERVASGVFVGMGTNDLVVRVPSWAATGLTYARFRLSEYGVAGPGGNGGLGEVEDYVVEILPPQASTAAFSEQVIANGNKGAFSLYPADVDGDGDLDLVANDPNQGNLSFHKNEGNGRFTQQVIATVGLSRRVIAADYNADGLMDVMTSRTGSGATWFRQYSDGMFYSNSFGSSNAAIPVDLMKDGRLDTVLATTPSTIFRVYDDSITSTARTLASGTTAGTAVDAADIDGDGDVDFLGATAGDNSLAWYEYVNTATGYSRRVISTDVAAIASASLVDLDVDGDLDVLTHAAGDGKIEWFENNGSQTFARHLIATITGVAELNRADVDGDGDLDLLVAAGAGGALLLTNDGEQAFETSTLPTSASVGIQTIVSGDFDGDGVLEIAVGGSNPISAQSGYLAILRRQLALDFGDAPALYGTQLARDGARHYSAGPKLGETRDSEPDGGSPSQEDGVDEDGVTFGALQVGASAASVTVNVQDAPLGARLDAWIDFNADGLFTSADERIAASLAVIEGDNVVTFGIPPTMLPDVTYARFRLSTIGNLGSVGGAPDGEVEDYAVTIEPAGDKGGLFASKQTIHPSSTGSIVITVDFDRDGDVDVLAAGTTIDWYDNDGAGNYTRRTINHGTWGTINSLQAADLDGDGDLDLLFKTPNSLFWHENLGNRLFETQSVLTNIQGYLEPAIVDLDRDGDFDLVLSGPSGMGIHILENQGPGRFVRRIPFAPSQSTPAYKTTAFAVADADGDGDLDFYVAPDDSNVRLALYRNEGQGTYSHAVLISQPDTERIQSLSTVDFDGDGDADLAYTIRNATTPLAPTAKAFGWYENRGSGMVDARPVATSIGPFRQAVIGDVDGDGDFDFVSSQVSFAELLWHENIGNGRFAIRQIAREPGVGNLSLYAGLGLSDFDGDGDLDVVTASQSGQGVNWFEQLLAPTADYGDAPLPYPVSVSAIGATHVATGPRLGAERDAEVGALNSLAGDGDGSDDDGVTFAPFRVGQFGATAVVNVQNAPLGAKIDAWVDFDGDGNWSRAEERIAVSKLVVEGENEISFDVPAWAMAGASYARIRISTAGGLSYLGAAADGEVEDHTVVISSPAAAVGPYFERYAINDDDAGLYYSIVAVDLDGDGDNDVVASPKEQDLAWYDNNGAGEFTRRTLTGAQASPGSSLSAADVDFDGDIDLVAAHFANFYWFENDGSQTFTRRYVDTYSGYSNLNGLVDVNGDGAIDFVGSNQWIPNLATATSAPYPWDFSSISYAATIADIDRDGSLDVLRTSPTNSTTTIGYHRFSLDEFLPATRLSDVSLRAGELSAVDIDRDGDLDLLVGIASSSPVHGGVFWLENDGRMNFTRRTISAFADFNGKLIAADIDGDGDLDVFSSHQPEAAWYENDGNQSFTKHAAPAFTAGYFRFPSLADMNGDGTLDVVAYEFSSLAAGGGFAWYSLTDRQLALSASPATIDEESTGAVTFTFTRAGNVAGQLTVPFIVGGTAQFGVDYTIEGASSFDAGSGTITFADGVTVVNVFLTPVDDTEKEFHEEITLTLPPIAGFSLSGKSATVTIRTGEHAGDYNDNGAVDGADFLAWQRSFGQTADPIGSDADGNRDGEVDTDDLTVWTTNFGQTTTVAPPTTPAIAALLASEESVSLATSDEQLPATLRLERNGRIAVGQMPALHSSTGNRQADGERRDRRPSSERLADQLFDRSAHQLDQWRFYRAETAEIFSRSDCNLIDAAHSVEVDEQVAWQSLQTFLELSDWRQLLEIAG